MVFREDKKGVAGLKLSAARSKAKFNLLDDFGAKKTSKYQGKGQQFATYVIDKKGVVRAVLTGNKKVRPLFAQLKQVFSKLSEQGDKAKE